MQKWEYLTAIKDSSMIACLNDELINREDQKTAMDFLEERGNEGWELVAITGHANHYETLYFKRPKS